MLPRGQIAISAAKFVGGAVADEKVQDRNTCPFASPEGGVSTNCAPLLILSEPTIRSAGTTATGEGGNKKAVKICCPASMKATSAP
ncbi:hypothetical protein WI99_36885 [Burkholderia cepacia]|uniref:Uncharacterized protein n=1 Tax=Burkholderia reimsis TaxID=2234132 RepID=A0A365R2R6_9BURK|nr:hypothetical protein WI99_36885 [Burkholderia cepacia]RBB42917.1 hypothetical protein DPV79_00965 [Burkholderia reimsis]